jgi:carboxypeptidase Taq
MDSYERLMEKYREYTLVSMTTDILGWDLETYMPPRGITQRSDQLSFMERISHRMLTSDELGRLLGEAEKTADSVDDVQRRNLHLLRRAHDIAVSVPEDLVAEIEGQRAVSWDAWAKARAARDWKIFEPELKKMVHLSIRYAEATMEAKGAGNAFDSCIDEYETAMTQDKTASLLADLRDSLTPLILKYGDAGKDADESVAKRSVPLDLQRKLITDAVNLIGYDTISDKARGRIDEVEHPFTTGQLDDVRITVRYYENNPLDALFSGLHEAGHALYEQNRNRDWTYQPVGTWASMGVHEAMSRFAENMIGRSRSFWHYYLPRMNTITAGAFSDVGLDDFLRVVNKVQPSKTRVSADELTYQIHVVIRFEIERMLIGGEIEVSELPRIWNELYDKYLHVEFDNDAEGVMQDVHWSHGYFGYFQSYSLGNIYAGMFLEKMERDFGSWMEEVEKGNPRVAIDWLKDNVQCHGALYDPEVLVERVTGKAPTVEPFVQYIRRRLSALWD